MSKPDIFIETAVLATREKTASQLLESGKINSKDAADVFLFYIIELPTANNSAAVKKITTILENKTRVTLTSESYEEALSEINQMLGRLSETSDNLWIGKLGAIIGLIDHDELLISQAGNITGYIFRKNKISSLTDQPDSESVLPPSRTFTDITSGTILVGDQLIFGSNELFNRVSVDRLRGFAKLDNAMKSANELKHYLKKIRVNSVNAILISANDEPHQSNSDDIIFVDDQEETTLTTAAKKMAPVFKRVRISSREILQISAKNGAALAEKWHRSWIEKYRPRSKKLLNESRDKISQGFKAGRHKITELSYNHENPSRLKIKANSYHKIDKQSFSFTPILDKILPAIKSFFSKKNRRLVIIIAFLLILIISYVKIKINNNNKESALHQVQVASAYDQASTLYTQAKKEMATGKTTSLDKFYQALKLAQTATEDKPNLDKTTTLIKQINGVIDDKTKTVRFYNAANYPIAKGITKIILAGSAIYGVDPDNKIFVVDTRDHQPKLVGSFSKDNGSASDLYYSKTTNAVFFNTSTMKLISFDLVKNTVTNPTNADSSWKGAQAIATYASNLYTLDPGAGTVWKYTLSNGSYSKATDYTDTRTVSLKGALDLSIDGNIFVLKADGSAAKFVKGAYQSDFSLRDVPAPLNTIGAPTKLFTDDTTNSIFVLDKKNNRIIKFDKSGEFNTQYVFDGVALDSFVVDAKLQKIWGLGSGKIYEGNL